MPAMLMEHTVDPRTQLRDAIGDLDSVEVFGNQILVAVYKRPERTKSGVFMPDSTRQEDEYQGKAGLVVKLGPLAFKDSEGVKFHGQKVDLGAWIAYRVSDGWSVRVNGTLCRMLDDTNVKLRIPAPDTIW